MPANLGTRFIMVLIGIFVLLAGVVVGGLLWAIFLGHPLFDGFWPLFGLVVAEPLGILFLWARNVLGIRSPEGKIMTFTNQHDINEYMKQLISSGSVVDIVSGRLSWVKDDLGVENAIVTHSTKATLTIFLPASNDIAERLSSKG